MLMPRVKTQAVVILVALSGLLPVRGAPVSVHDWSFEGPGGRYGITETAYTLSFRLTRRGSEMATETYLWFGPLGRRYVPSSAPVAALGLTAGTIILFGLSLYGTSKLSYDKQKA
jgi:hypothetical protein